MIKLERIERYILIFLIAALLLGITVSALRKIRPPAKVAIGRFDPASHKNALDETVLPIDKININSASVEDLEKIKGIGKTIALRIVEYRYQNGGFASIDDLKNVKGVSVARFEKIKARIIVE
jgi:competence ComEA-like helix-hairpin-helix protein